MPRTSNKAEQIVDFVNAFVQENGLYPVNSNQIYYIEAKEEDQVSLPEENGNWLEQAWNAIVDFLS